MRTSAVGLLSLLCLAGPLAAQEGKSSGGPLSAIDWLSESVATPVAAGTSAPAPVIDEPPVTNTTLFVKRDMCSPWILESEV